MPIRKIKLDFLKKEEVSPYLIDLREKEEKKEKPIKEIKKIHFNIHPHIIFKKISIFLGIFIFISAIIAFVWFSINQISNLKQEISDKSFNDVQTFFKGVDSLKNLDFKNAENKFTLADDNFSQTLDKIRKTNFLVQAVLQIYPPSRSGIKLLNIFKDASEAGFLVSTAEKDVQPFLIFDQGNLENSLIPVEISNFNFLPVSNFIKQRTNRIIFLINRIENNFSKLNIKYIPQDFQPSFSLVKDDLPILQDNLKIFSLFLANLEKIFAQNSTKKYLILFQNNNELRPTGGFLGTFAEFVFTDGQIKKFNLPAGGTYDLAGALSVRVAPPKPLLIAYPKWQFHDANWFPDWPSSAQKLNWFYERSGGETVDGIIAFNAELLPEILKITGDINLPQYQETFTPNNIVLEIEKIIELERKDGVKEKPKQIIVDLMPILLKRIIGLSSEKSFQLIETFYQGLENKKILLYFSDAEIEKFFQERHWIGEIREAPLDYLMINSANINGAKAEGKIDEKVSYQAEIQNDGTILSNLTIQRTHNGILDEPFFGRKDVSWLRAYLPKGSVFLGTRGGVKQEFPKTDKIEVDQDLTRIEKEISIDQFSGTRITEEFNKTCFGKFLEINPGQQNEITYKYFLPFKLDFSQKDVSYSLFIQKQPGRDMNFEATINLPVNKKMIWSYPDGEIIQDGKIIRFSSIINRDKIFAFILE